MLKLFEVFGRSNSTVAIIQLFGIGSRAMIDNKTHSSRRWRASLFNHLQHDNFAARLYNDVHTSYCQATSFWKLKVGFKFMTQIVTNTFHTALKNVLAAVLSLTSVSQTSKVKNNGEFILIKFLSFPYHSPVSDLSADRKRMKIIRAMKHTQKAIARKLTGPSLSNT